MRVVNGLGFIGEFDEPFAHWGLKFYLEKLGIVIKKKNLFIKFF